MRVVCVDRNVVLRASHRPGRIGRARVKMENKIVEGFGAATTLQLLQELCGCSNNFESFNSIVVLSFTAWRRVTHDGTLPARRTHCSNDVTLSARREVCTAAANAAAAGSRRPIPRPGRPAQLVFPSPSSNNGPSHPRPRARVRARPALHEPRHRRRADVPLRRRRRRVERAAAAAAAAPRAHIHAALRQRRQGLRLVHVRAQLEQLQDTFMGQVGLHGGQKSST